MRSSWFLDTSHHRSAATDFYEYGWGQSFHFAAQRTGEPYQQAIARHEHFLALKLNLQKGQTALVRVRV